MKVQHNVLAGFRAPNINVNTERTGGPDLTSGIELPAASLPEFTLLMKSLLWGQQSSVLEVSRPLTKFCFIVFTEKLNDVEKRNSNFGPQTLHSSLNKTITCIVCS